MPGKEPIAFLGWEPGPINADFELDEVDFIYRCARGER